MDERKFNAGTMANIFKYGVQGRDGINDRLDEVAMNIKGYYLYYLFAGMLLLLFIICSNCRGSLIAGGYFIYCFAGIMGLQFFFRFPSHIATQVFMIMFLVMIFWACSFELKVANRRKGVMLIIALLPLLTLKIDDLYKKVCNTAWAADLFYRAYVVQLNQKYPGGTFILPVMPHLAMPIEYYSSPLTDTRLKINIVPCGWLTYSPVFLQEHKEISEC